MMKTASYKPIEAEVASIKKLSPDTISLRLEITDSVAKKDFSFSPGQFLMLSLFGYGEVTLAFTSNVEELPFFEVAIKSVGSTTQAIHRLKVGDTVGFRGPFGKPYPLDRFAGKKILVVAGGLGLAPLRSLIKTVESDPLVIGELAIYAGFRSVNDILYKNEIKSWEKFAKVNISVNVADSGWKGPVGLITELFDRSEITKESIAILCGPEVMFAPTTKKLCELGVKTENIYVMLERRMKCGIGKCQHCTCGEKYVCMDGPIFSYKEIKNNFEAGLS